MSVNAYDYIIIGAGASGLQLALAMSRDTYFDDKKIGIIERKTQFDNDKTWCFWEEGKGHYDAILFCSWDKGYVRSLGKTVDFDLGSYRYKMLKSKDFYNFAISKLTLKSNFTIIFDEISSTELENNISTVTGKKGNYKAKHIFDSRLPTNFKPEKSINILQHFKGWFIETENEVFDNKAFCMMDYNHTKAPETAFMYILPFSKTKALVEYTYFTPNLVDEATYDKRIKSYLKNVLKVDSYRIEDIEKGVIPMTTYPFHSQSNPNLTKIGTSGGWVKPSTGYSFKNAERLSLKVIKNIKANRTPSYNLFRKRYKHYDKMFLNVLYNHNAYGKRLFYNMYSRNKIQDIFRFLDEKSNFNKDLQIMATMTSYDFIKAFFKHASDGFGIS
jgi:lycopene beta-cyclase